MKIVGVFFVVVVALFSDYNLSCNKLLLKALFPLANINLPALGLVGCDTVSQWKVVP